MIKAPSLVPAHPHRQTNHLTFLSERLLSQHLAIHSLGPTRGQRQCAFGYLASRLVPGQDAGANIGHHRDRLTKPSLPNNRKAEVEFETARLSLAI